VALDQKQLESLFKKLRNRLKKFPRQPAPKQVHKLRTRSRRVEAALEALSPDGKGGQKRLLKVLDRVRKRAGKVRDMDVLTSYLTGRKVPESENDCLVVLIEHLGAERSRQAGKLRKAIKQDGVELRRHLRKYAQKIARMAAHADGGTSGREPDPVAHAITEAVQTSSDLAAPRLGPANLHQYRLTVKRLVNVLEMAKDEDQDRRLVTDLKRVKDAIGEWHDWQVLEEIAGNVLDHNGCRLQSLLRATVRQKYQEALSTANAVKVQYFPAAERARTQSSRPVMNAALRIAA
jgi:CHAD domain-containing protein